MLKCFKMLLAVMVVSVCSLQAVAEDATALKVGMIGLDTSHSIAFTKVLNAADAAEEVSNCKVTIAYPYGSRKIESSYSRIPGYIDQMKEMDVNIAESIDEVLAEVDVVLLETNDGNPHLELFDIRKPSPIKTINFLRCPLGLKLSPDQSHFFIFFDSVDILPVGLVGENNPATLS